MKILKRNQRFFLAFVILIVFFLTNQGVQDVIKDKPKECSGKSCYVAPKKSTINSERPEIFFQDIIKSEPGGFYRFIVKARITGNISLNVLLANSATAETVHVGTIDSRDGQQYLGEEIVFKTESEFNGIVLQKNNPSDSSEVFIQDLKVSPLNVKSEREISDLRPSVLGSPLTGQHFAERSLSNRFVNQINKNGIFFGQVFRAESDSVSSVVFDPEILKLNNTNNNDFVLELRKLDKQEGVFHIEAVMESVVFSKKDTDRYHNNENKINIPLHSYISEGEYYYVGIRRNNTDISGRSYIDTFGERDSQYFDGRTLEFTDGQVMEVSDSLYFKVFGFFLVEYLDQQSLSGAILEDLGKGRGSYTYKSLGNKEELLDIIAPAPDIGFDDDKKTVYGRSTGESESFFEYKFDTMYSFDSVRISARQADSSWERVSLLVSFDQKKWNEVPWEDVEGVRYFSQEEKFSPPVKAHVFYLKVVPDGKGNGKYGIKNLVVEAGLYMP
jgi:hypothetical protein